ncbi:MAG: AAA family ATPase [Cyanobacteria bacterium SBLK]|nr:AAA family ATPase [Cyanobacteria bacterium SBLK]
MNDWKIFQGNCEPHDGIEQLPDPPSWRPFGTETQPGESRRKRRGETFQVRPEEVEAINAALYLRRPLLVTGKPGTGKSSLAYAVARELKLGEVLYWPITTRTTLKDGLYYYDAIGRLQEAKQQEYLFYDRGKQSGEGEQSSDRPVFDLKQQLQQIEKYITLGPLGTALLPSPTPRVLLIDEIDKSDIDLPNNLLTIFEEGWFEIPELVRIKDKVDSATIRTAYTDERETTRSHLNATIPNGRVVCKAFPFVVMTSNGERDFPAPFLRRCLRLKMKNPKKSELTRIVAAHLGEETALKSETLIDRFIAARDEGTLATDQLLNAIFMVVDGRVSDKAILISQLLKDLGRMEDEDE